MKGRGRSAAFTSHNREELELLDAVSPETSVESTESVATSDSRRSALAVVAGLLVAVLGVAALTSTGPDDEGPTTPPSPTTIAPPPTEAPAREQTVAEIGSGPEINWERVQFDVDAMGFEWVEDGFLAIRGVTEYLLRPTGTLTISRSRFAQGDVPIRSSQRVLGDGTDNPSELTFVGRTPERVGLIPLAIPESQLVDAQIRIAVERSGNRALVLQTLNGVLDVGAFNERTGNDVPILDLAVGDADITLSTDRGQVSLPISDLELDGNDLAALRTLGEPRNQLSVAEINGEAKIVEVDLDRIDWIAAISDDFVVGGAELRRSNDGEAWRRTGLDTPQFGGLLRPGPDGVIVGLGFDEDRSFVTRSENAARDWDKIPSPLSNVWQISSVAPVVAITGWADTAFVPAPAGWSILTPEFELVIGADDDSFELLTRSGEQVLTGLSSDLNSGFRFAPGSDDIWFVDPSTGDEIARFPRLLFAAAFASSRTLDGRPQLVALADTSQPGSTEWSLTPVNEVFGADALAVEFVPGDGWFLADVTTTTGRELYLAEVPRSAAE